MGTQWVAVKHSPNGEQEKGQRPLEARKLRDTQGAVKHHKRPILTWHKTNFM
jgi:hypothetical protein